LSSVHTHYSEPIFATGGNVVQIWNYERSHPIETFDWGIDSVVKVRFNPSETNLLLGTSLDRSVILYDIKGNTPLRKVTMKNKSNAICWNPYEPINFTVGNEDGNAYTFDMRKTGPSQNDS
jgi:WD repeat and SOF domain-containing protein 1